VKLRTERFGEIALVDREGTFQFGGQTVELDVFEASETGELLRHDLGAFLDELPTHLNAAKAHFIDVSFKDMADYVPQWLADELPEIYTRAFGALAPDKMDGNTLWSALRLKRIWGDDDGISVDHTFLDDDSGYVFTANFAPNGTLNYVALES